MKSSSENSHLTRRRFARSSLTGAAAVLSASWVRGAGATGETEHFHYRLAPPGPYVDSQRGSQAFGIGAGRIHLSEDNARTWSRGVAFADAAQIDFSCLLADGNIVFATRSRIFVSTDRLRSYRELTVHDEAGRPFVPRPPRNLAKAGWHFYSLDGRHTFPVGGREMLVWGSYCNVRSEPVPANIYYSVDGGETVKIAYSFGQNPRFQYPDAAVGDRLGNSDNPVICRHVHSVAYNPDEDAFYACTGDIERGHGKECHWLRGVYDATADRWRWRVIVSSDANSRYKSGGINFVDGRLHWVADANGPKTPAESYDRGIFRCDPADLANPAKHTRLFDAKYEIACMTVAGNVMLAPHYGNASPFDTGFMISPDLGRTWAEYDLKQFGDRSGVRVSPPNDEGWFRVGLRRRWLDRGEVLFIKPKS
jgi:hypothetical protein